MQQYSEIVLDHFHNPRNAGALPVPDATGYADLNGNAPRVTIFLNVDGGLVVDASFATFGCGAMIACCSIITEMAKGRAIGDCQAFTPSDVVNALGGLPGEKTFCADLAVNALRSALTSVDKQGCASK